MENSSYFSILSGVLEFVSPDVTTIINSLIEKSLPTSPPYDAWFKNKDVLTVKIYFQEKLKFNIWQKKYLNKKNVFKKITVKNKKDEIIRTIFTKTTERIKIKIIVPQPPEHKKDFQAEVFESMIDPDVNWIIYNGHSGMGAELALSFNRAPELTDIILKNPKLIQCVSCTSCENYLGKFRNLYPNSQFLGTLGEADSRDGCTIFAAVPCRFKTHPVIFFPPGMF